MEVIAESSPRPPPGSLGEEPEASSLSGLTRRVSFTLRNELQRKFYTISGATTQTRARGPAGDKSQAPGPHAAGVPSAAALLTAFCFVCSLSGDGKHINLSQFQAALKGRLSSEQARLVPLCRALV